MIAQLIGIPEEARQSPKYLNVKDSSFRSFDRKDPKTGKPYEAATVFEYLTFYLPVFAMECVCLRLFPLVHRVPFDLKLSPEALSPALMRLLCDFYKQDFVCFGFELPRECL